MRDRLLNMLADLVWRRPATILVVAALLAIACGIFAAITLRLNANLDDLIAPDRPFMAEYRRLLEEFGDLEHIILAIDASRDREAAQRAADRLVARLRAMPDLPGVYGVIEPDEQWRIATRAMSDDDLRDLALTSTAFGGLLGGEVQRVIAEANGMLDALVTGGATMSPDEAQRLGASAVLLLKSIAAAQPDSESRRDLAFLIDAPPRQYLQSDTGRLLFINILPSKDYGTLSVVEEPLRRIRADIEHVQQEIHRDAAGGSPPEIGLTGKPVLQYDETVTSNRDMTRAAAIALMLCSVLFMIVIGGVVRPLLAVTALGIAFAWTYGLAALIVGQLNLLSIVFMLVLVGVGLDYGVHVIARYQEFLARGDDVGSALRGAMVAAGRGNITGALTSSAVFLMALFTTFQGLRELGLIAGGGLVLCLLAMTLVLPALLAIVDRRRRVPARSSQSSPAVNGEEPRGARLERWLHRRAGAVLLLSLAVTIALVLAPGTLRFEYNLLELQAEGLESVEWERRIVNDSASASWFGAIIADDQAEALAVIERARIRPTIGAIRSVFDVIRPDTPQRDQWRGELHRPGEPAPAAAPPTEPPSLTQAIARLRTLAQLAALRSPEEAHELSRLASELEAIDERDPAARSRIEQTLAVIAANLTRMLAGDRLPLREALPEALRDHFVSRAGRYLVMLHPRENVWEYEPMQAFIADLRAVDSSVTGTPVTHFESLGEMLRSFVVMSVLALAVIIVLLAIDFRAWRRPRAAHGLQGPDAASGGWRDVLLALAPLVLGLILTVETMGLLGLSFNLANFFAAPMLIGLGVDAAVHILHRAREGGNLGASSGRMGATRRAVILTALTTIIGFGALIIAHHRGLRSLGLVMVIGSMACMLSSVFVLPAMLALLERRTARR